MFGVGKDDDDDEVAAEVGPADAGVRVGMEGYISMMHFSLVDKHVATSLNQ